MTGQSSFPNPWVVLATFVLGVIGGVLLDRSIGGPGGLTVGIIVLLIPGTLAFVGPFAQQYWSNRFSTENTNRVRFREHADHLLNRVFWPLASASLTYDVTNYQWAASGLYCVSVSDSVGGRPSMDSLVQWPFARSHLLSDPNTGPALKDVEERIERG